MRWYLLLSLILFGQPLYAETSFAGYIKDYSVIQDKIDNNLLQLDRTYQSQLSGRLMLNYFKGNQTWQLHYELGRDFNSARFQVPGFAGTTNNDYRLSDIRGVIGPIDTKNRSVQNLDRLNVQLQLKAGDLTIGRQAITFGSARIINPTDVFLPFDVQTLNTEYRAGIDAIRFQHPIGQLGEIDVGVVLGNDASTKDSAAFLRLRTNILSRDYQFTLMQFSDQQLAGFGVQSALGELGFWFETAFVSGDQAYNRTSIGVDYAFNSSWIGTIEYHYNGAGSIDPRQYLTNLSSRPYRDGGVFLLGKDYLIPVISWQASALLNLSLQSITNLDDGSLFINFNADYSLSENLYLGVSYYLFSGKDVRLEEGQISPGSEYGSNPNRFIASLRYYF